ncbi:3-hydroxyacyl-CoA dehydrogenase NAD-binding domain-containing protein, partial [Paraburkholderia sp. SIMBA_053]|uniref:3-hydroxyacyl-CoA dehydrogenase NAD-binding domain-containing protein n=1 Tax=Paraburkholderia sp. SIMBA_053 TaxID=3085794 RepID=UPI00397D9F9F
GRAWAIVFARSGFRVKLHDASQDMLRDAVPAIRESVQDPASFDLIDEPVDALVARITTCETLAEAVAEADLVQENIAEIVDVKRTLFA